MNDMKEGYGILTYQNGEKYEGFDPFLTAHDRHGCQILKGCMVDVCLCLRVIMVYRQLYFFVFRNVIIVSMSGSRVQTLFTTVSYRAGRAAC